MEFSNEGREESGMVDKADKELDIELKRIKIIKKMGWFKGRTIL
jgi:hypothetical protein